jgi:hypothetical protein
MGNCSCLGTPGLRIAVSGVIGMEALVSQLNEMRQTVENLMERL